MRPFLSAQACSLHLFDPSLLTRSHSQACGLSALFPASSTTLDSYAFTPCGYSANALVHSPVDASEGYWTVHVTPEATHSYASFESNIALPSTASPVGGFPDLRTLIRNVVEIFEPGRLTLTLFLSSEEAATEEGWGKGAKVLAEKTLLPGYRRRDRCVVVSRSLFFPNPSLIQRWRLG